MVIFLVVLLGISIVGLVALLSIKRWELTTGKMLLSQSRPHVGAFLGSAAVAVERHLPALVRRAVHYWYRRIFAFVLRLVALLVLYAERLLERTLHLLRHSTSAPRGEQPSEFLREVAEHKKALQNGEQGAIYED